jgi:hypothetical protein
LNETSTQTGREDGPPLRPCPAPRGPVLRSLVSAPLGRVLAELVYVDTCGVTAMPCDEAGMREQ